MRYYKLGQDRRIPYTVVLTDLPGTSGGNLYSLDRAIVSQVDSGQLNFYADILDRNIFMVRGPVKEVFDLFLPDLEYKHCCLLDNPHDRYDIYYIPMLEELDVQEGVGLGEHIFRIAGTKEVAVAASLEVVEAVLRRNPAGIRISPIR